MSLKEIIKSSGKTQQQVADEMGVHQTLVSQWGRKKTKLSLVDAVKLAQILGATVEDIAECVTEEPQAD